MDDTHKLLLKGNLLKLELLELGRGGAKQRSCGEDGALHLGLAQLNEILEEMERNEMRDELVDAGRIWCVCGDGRWCCCWEDGTEEGDGESLGDDTSGGAGGPWLRLGRSDGT